MAMNTTFEQYIRLLEQFAAREGHTRIPVAHIEDLDGTRVKLGAWSATSGSVIAAEASMSPGLIC
jgi:hypothetical protein